MKKHKNIILRLPVDIYHGVLKDLRRKHTYAYERVCFMYGRTAQIDDKTIIITCFQFIPVEDHNYILDKTVGAKINSASIREAMQFALDNKCSCFHVHLHDFLGKPTPSSTDKTLDSLIIDISNVAPDQVHGILILSENGFYAKAKIPNKTDFKLIDQISVIGYPMHFQFEKPRTSKWNKIYDRQSFLGKMSQFLFENVRVGIVGLGGGGSHIAQQLSHVGIVNVVVFDDDKVEDTNLNRLIGAWFTDIKRATLKTNVAKRLMKKVLPSANVELVNDRWQKNPEKLQKCDIVVGCVDSYSERQQLEAECRRFLIPYIDIGMDITNPENAPYISGQVILSMPGMPCMFCTGFLTEQKLGLEAAKYGDIGGRPQVVWPNGVLASSALGVLVDLITGWTGIRKRVVYLGYDGNLGTITNHIRLQFAPKNCAHFAFEETGPPIFKPL